MSLQLEEIASRIKSVLPQSREKIGLHEPVFTGRERDFVLECIDTGWVSSVGTYVTRFEEMLSEITGIPYAIAVVSGTAALHVALKLAGVLPDDEVLVPSLTFIATANAIVYCQATPHFVDCSNRTLGVDPDKLEHYLKDIADIRNGACHNRITGKRIKAVVPMHTFGHPVELDRLSELCKQYNIELVEDAAEALGSYYQGKHVGQWGKLSIFSFNGNKIVTTGGGGAILTSDEHLAKHAKHLTTTAKIPHSWEYIHDEVGYNYRLPNINAALGCAQLEQLNTFIEFKRNLTTLYKEALSGLKGVTMFEEPLGTRSNYWLQTLLVDEEYVDQRDEILQVLNEQGIGSRPVWHPLHKLPMFQACPRMDLSIAEMLAQRIINIPSSVF